MIGWGFSAAPLAFTTFAVALPHIHFYYSLIYFSLKPLFKKTHHSFPSARFSQNVIFLVNIARSPFSNRCTSKLPPTFPSSTKPSSNPPFFTQPLFWKLPSLNVLFQSLHPTYLQVFLPKKKIQNPSTTHSSPTPTIQPLNCPTAVILLLQNLPKVECLSTGPLQIQLPSQLPRQPIPTNSICRLTRIHLQSPPTRVALSVTSTTNPVELQLFSQSFPP